MSAFWFPLLIGALWAFSLITGTFALWVTLVFYGIYILYQIEKLEGLARRAIDNINRMEH